jgi:hypothetical protein
MLRRFRELLHTSFLSHLPAEKADQAALLFSEQRPQTGPERPPLQMPVSLIKPEKVTSLPPLPRPMAPLQTEFFKAASLKAAPVRTASAPARPQIQAPSLAEICAEQAPTSLLKTLHEQARWFYEYRPSAAAHTPLDVLKPIIRCTPMTGLLDYQRMQLFVESGHEEHISIDLEVDQQPEALVLIGDVQPGQFSSCRLRVPTNREIEVCFRIFAPQKGESQPPEKALYAIRLSPVESKSELEAVLSKACFSAEAELVAV